MKNLVLPALLALAAGPSLAQEVVRLGTEGAYAPYNYLDDNGEVAGFERAVGDALCERAVLNCQWVTNEWDSIIPNLTSGNYDVIIAAMSITDERDEVIDFTQDYYPPAPSAYAATDEGVDFDGGVVAAQTGTLQAGYVAETNADLLEFSTMDEAMAAVRNGEADAVFGDKDALVPLVEASAGEFMFVGSDIPLGDGIGLGLRESDTELKEKLDKAITEMKQDGSLNELLVTWFGEGIETY